ncbi:DUF1445-domain-containing protein [Guyanagaster necrorhizus]|uniref:DUF1445-domain-containing protein n=1 Tax=Guyanagaster necrorhizus TaxID=856835 RepID=A0A9P8AQN4_9AGAR|nr:DUF1445-domain-containing protein [Guyanagaster necrorhizus MCA 3950]KAG7444304.1 DUF1445-domain-containing protein [Guyanagaster necrorhizus MCA 3950]
MYVLVVNERLNSEGLQSGSFSRPFSTRPGIGFAIVEIRSLRRADAFKEASTAGLCAGHVQAKVIILPQKYADDFRWLCLRNPVSCPLFRETKPGDARVPEHLASNSNICTDCPLYNIYRDGVFVESKRSLEDYWQPDSIAFFLDSGLTSRHTGLGRNVPMYRTNVPLMATGAFSGLMVVSTRPYPISQISKVHNNGAKALGLTDFDGSNPDFGDPSEIREGEVAVYWGCNVTPQVAVMDSKIDGIVMGHEPGQMLVLDIVNQAVCKGEL